MLLECTLNRIGDLPEIDRKHVGQSVHADEVHLKQGRQYVAFGIIIRVGLPWYLVCEEDDAEYPTPHYAGFFKIIDDGIPLGWSFQWRGGAWPDGAFIPTAWCKPGFFEALVDGSADELALFRSKRAEIEAASQNNQIAGQGQAADC